MRKAKSLCPALNVPNIVVGVRNETPLEIWIWRDTNYNTINHPARMGVEIINSTYR